MCPSWTHWKRAPGRNGRELFLSFRSNSPLRFFSKHARHPVNRNEPCAPRLPELSFLKARESSFLPRTCLSHSRVPEAPSLARFFDGHDIINHHVSPSTLLRLTQAAMCPWIRRICLVRCRPARRFAATMLLLKLWQVFCYCSWLSQMI